MSSFSVTLPSGETWTPQFVQNINEETCIGCGRCFKVCPRDVLDLIVRGEDMEMDEEKKASFIESADQIFSDLSMGKISYDFLSKIYVAENHQKEVDAAVENAIIEGKNMAIDEKKEAAKVSKVGDGMPSLASAVPEAKPVTQKPKSTTQKFFEGTGIVK